MFPTVREVLALDPVRLGAPRVVAGEAGLDRTVRWVHSAEVPDIAHLLRGGELVLSTGIGLPADDDGLRRFVSDLAEVGACGLVLELGRRYATSVPRAMVAAAQRHGLPLIELHRATPFVPVTEAVHGLIIDAQLAELRATEEIHQRFTELSVEGAEPAEVVAQAAVLAGAPVVLENLARQVLAYDAAGERAELLLDGWESYSRRIRPAGRTGYDPDSGWLVTVVGARGQDWGRLLLRWEGPGPGGSRGANGAPPTRLSILLERAASALALGRLIRRDAEDLARQIHRTLLTALLDHTGPVDEVALRARALGVPLERRHLVGVVVRHRADPPEAPTSAQARLRDLAEAVGQAVREARLSGLASVLDDHAVGALLALKSADEAEMALFRFAAAVRSLARAEVVVAAGSGVDSPREARRSLLEARQVAHAARRDRRMSGAGAGMVYRLPDVGLAGLLHLLRDEPRLQTFVERELGGLLTYDAQHPREHLLGTLRAYLECGRNKSAAAEATHLSRPAFYERLARISRIVGADLDAVDVCLSLHVALLALDAVRDA
ncbi:PucR family transcriptional regulator [Planosporangium flavigriseum]|uniref:CdaR family transcriptional regulator n=1 Tax=Planosporangium flavigriseum TaxID=373681 RepID=A0A8J3LMJ7_9ACTN|nr:PucR family transcriptional regulator [Planosporangium flavigriseum]NJC65386.1 PucR family transcriptional regulator [Planosporangium flavigriseum]GIG73258.1 CdaR family transcriptional regulator [Planosporangium flavigriseum]